MSSWRRYIITSCLAVLVVISALMSVGASHVSRQQFHQLQLMRKEHLQLQTTYGQLLLEQGTLSAPSLIEKTVTKTSVMKVPNKDEVVLVK